MLVLLLVASIKRRNAINPILILEVISKKMGIISFSAFLAVVFLNRVA